MKHSVLLWFLFMTVLVMGTVHILALKLSLYWQYLWLDIPMHFFGGAIVALGVLLLPSMGMRVPTRYLLFVPVLSAVCIVGLAWEVFEIWAGIPLIEPGFEKDIILDLCMDLIGGTFGYIVGKSIISLDT